MADIHLVMASDAKYKSRRRRSHTTVCQSVVASLACLFLLVQSTTAQQIGVDVCACQPSVYEFTFDFELTCDDQSVGGEGITDTTCLTELRGEQNQEDADLLPVAVGQVSIFELDQNLDVIAQTVNTGLFLSGSTFTYTSIIATEPELLNPDSLPRGIQLVFIGVNSLNQAIVNTFAILYNNDCGVFPLLRVGQQAGWIIFTDLGNPPEEVCPIAASPSSSPSSSVSQPPVRPNAPTSTPSNVTIAPVPVPSLAPVSPTLSDAPSSVPSVRCPTGKRRGKGTSKLVQGKGKGHYQKKRKEHSAKDKDKGQHKLTIESGKRRGPPTAASEDARGKGKGTSTKSSAETDDEEEGMSTESSADTSDEEEELMSTKSSAGTDDEEEGTSTTPGRGTGGKGKGIQRKRRESNRRTMSRIGKNPDERLLGIGRVDYQNKDNGSSNTTQRPSPFEPISKDVNGNDDSDDTLDDSDDDNTSGDYADDDENDDDDFECIEPDYPNIASKGSSPTESSKSNGKGKGTSTKSSSKGASTKASSSKGTSLESTNSKGNSTKSSYSKGTGQSANTAHNNNSQGQAKGASSTRRQSRNKRQRPSYRNDRTMTKLQKGGDERFRDLMEQEYVNYWGS